MGVTGVPDPATTRHCPQKYDPLNIFADPLVFFNPHPLPNSYAEPVSPWKTYIELQRNERRRQEEEIRNDGKKDGTTKINLGRSSGAGERKEKTVKHRGKHDVTANRRQTDN